MHHFWATAFYFCNFSNRKPCKITNWVNTKKSFKFFLPDTELFTTFVLCWYLPVSIEDLLGQHTGVDTKALVNSWPFLNQDLVLVIGVIPSKKLSWSSVMNNKMWGCFKKELVKSVKKCFCFKYVQFLSNCVKLTYYFFVKYFFHQKIQEMRSKQSMGCLILV